MFHIFILIKIVNIKVIDAVTDSSIYYQCISEYYLSAVEVRHRSLQDQGFIILFTFKFHIPFFFVLSFEYGSSLPSHEEIAEVVSIEKDLQI